MKRLDKETQDVLNEGKALKELLDSDGWQILERRLNEVLVDIQSVMSIDTEAALKNQDLLAQIGGRQIAVQIITNIIAGVKGDAEQYDNHTQVFRDEDAGMIVRYH